MTPAVEAAKRAGIEFGCTSTTGVEVGDGDYAVGGRARRSAGRRRSSSRRSSPRSTARSAVFVVPADRQLDLRAVGQARGARATGRRPSARPATSSAASARSASAGSCRRPSTSPRSTGRRSSSAPAAAACRSSSRRRTSSRSPTQPSSRSPADGQESPLVRVIDSPRLHADHSVDAVAPPSGCPARLSVRGGDGECLAADRSQRPGRNARGQREGRGAAHLHAPAASRSTCSPGAR